MAGYANLFQMVGQWSAEQFGFTPETPVESSSLMYPSPGPVITSGNDIRDILVQNGIKENVIPKWMPDGFKLLDEISVYEFGSSGNLQVDAAYSDGTDFYHIRLSGIKAKYIVLSTKKMRATWKSIRLMVLSITYFQISVCTQRRGALMILNVR